MVCSQLKQFAYTFIAQWVSRQLEILNIFQQAWLEKGVEIFLRNDGIFNVENINAFLEWLILVHWAKHLNKSIFFVVFEQEVQVNS